MLSLPFILLLASTLTSPSIADYTCVQDFVGGTFYDGFEFFTDADPTDGHVKFVDKITANQTGIAGLMDGGAASNAVYLAVDSTNPAPQGRPALRLTSSQSFMHFLLIADIAHMPTGCGTWPALWTLSQGAAQGTETWPSGGEIDIIEGVNNATGNHATLHTGPGVTINNGTGTTMSGTVVTSNCDINAQGQDQNAGCSVADNDTFSFGAGFNTNNGGVYAMEWTTNLIKLWFFPRGSIPNDIATDTPDPTSSGWGTPRAVFQGDSNMDTHFHNQSIILDTTFCGQWAGRVWITSECASLAPTCEEYVTSNPSAFTEAYWAINKLHVFQDDGQPASQTNGTWKRSGGSTLPSKV